jgi:vanillate O-demethylase monooxygenase subunit
MYHGMTFGTDGACLSVPLMRNAPDVRLRVYPVVEKNDWIWVWTGEPAAADEALIPDAYGINDPERPMRSNSIEYDAHYQLVHDNLCDLSHVDFVHATTLQPATGARWSETAPRVRMQGRAIHIERWFENAVLPGGSGEHVDVWSTYDFAVPGIFIMHGSRFAPGTAAACDYKAPVGMEPLVQNIEQQAVTPISDTRTAYHYATGLIGSTREMTAELAKRMDVVMATFEEDRQIIEAQQKIWDLTPSQVGKLFLPQDKAPAMMRQLMEKLITAEQASKDEHKNKRVSA